MGKGRWGDVGALREVLSRVYRRCQRGVRAWKSSSSPSHRRRLALILAAAIAAAPAPAAGVVRAVKGAAGLQQPSSTCVCLTFYRCVCVCALMCARVQVCV